MKVHEKLLATMFVTLTLTGVVPIAANAADPGVLAVVPVTFSTTAGRSPLPQFKELTEALGHAWGGPIVSGKTLDTELRQRWLPPAEFGDLQREMKAATKPFDEGDPTRALPLLERLVTQGDRAVERASSNPTVARELLRAHLLHWWSLRRAGETTRLRKVMAQVAARFPTAAIDDEQMPPYVIEAYTQAQAQQREASAVLGVTLVGGGSQCEVFVNGIKAGSGRALALELPEAHPYAVSARCAGVSTPAHRVILDGTREMEIEMDLDLWRATRRGSSGPVSLEVSAQPEAVAKLTALALAFGEASGHDKVLCVGQIPGDRVRLQIDRFDASEGRRLCSVRVDADGALAAAARSVARCTPESGDLLFAGADNVYRTPTEAAALAQDSPRIWTWVVGSVAIASLSTALAWEFIVASAQSDLDACVDDPKCRSTARSDALRDQLNDEASTRDAFYVGAALFTAGAVGTYFLESWASSTASDEMVLRLTPWVGPETVGAALDVRLP